MVPKNDPPPESDKDSMYDHEIRWFALIPVSLLLGFFILLAEVSNLWGNFPIRPDWFWVLAFYAALRTPPVGSILAFAWCGLVRDMLVGPRPGSACIAFILVGWMVLYGKPLASVRGMIGQAAAAGACGFLVALIRHGLDLGWAAGTIWERVFFLSLGEGLLCSLVYIPAAAILSLPPFCPWRPRGGVFL